MDNADNAYLQVEIAELRNRIAQLDEMVGKVVGKQVSDAEIAAQCSTPRQYDCPAVSVGAEATYTMQFGGEYDVPDTMAYGLPETIQKWGGVEHDFVLESLVVDDDTAAHFSVTSVILGGRALWRYGVEIPASRFAESASRVRFDELIRRGLFVTVQIRNIMKEPHTLSMRIVGRERGV